tara:strand:- start:229 stop:870 length:642 start_codon:yes stop_codon:yes gene_type:complete
MPKILEEWKADDTDYSGLNRIEKELKLSTSKYTNMSNMYMFDSTRGIKKYNDVLEIIEEFYHVRLDTYEKRRIYEINELEKRLNIVSAKYRFILEFINDELIIMKRKKADLYNDLSVRKYPKYDNNMIKLDDNTEDVNNTYYNYLTKMPIDSLTEEKLADLSKEQDNIEKEITMLKGITNKEMWKTELDNFEGKYTEYINGGKSKKKKLVVKH